MFKSELLIFPSSPFPPDVVATKRIRMITGEITGGDDPLLPAPGFRQGRGLKIFPQSLWGPLKTAERPPCLLTAVRQGLGTLQQKLKKRQEGLGEAASARESRSRELAQLTHRAGQALGAVLYRLPREHRQREAREQCANQTLLPFTTMLHNPPFVTKCQWGGGQLEENLGEDKAVSETALNVHRNKMEKKNWTNWVLPKRQCVEPGRKTKLPWCDKIIFSIISSNGGSWPSWVQL